VLLAAIDAIENVEPMLLRAGGFDEQIALAAPAADNLGRVVEQWLANKKVQLARGLRVQDIAAIMAGFTFGEIHGVLQRALNRAILRTPARELVTISREDLGMATQGNATPARRGRAPA
jgi:ATP-dependent 26S proteasome regulatory subunit